MRKLPIPIIYYHSVGEVNKIWRKNYLTLELKYLDDQLKYISKNFTTIDLFEYWEIRNKLRNDVINPLVITFDDGYLDNWIWAFPLLKKYKLKATIFVSPEFVDNREIVRLNLEDFWNGNATMEDLKQWGFLSWQEMQIMVQSGFVNIESHTMTHTKYTVSDKLIEFHHPGGESLYTIGNLFPERKPYNIGDLSFEKLIPYGYPIFESASSVCARKVFINEEFIDKCIQIFEGYDFKYYTFNNAFKNVKDLYSAYKKNNLLISGTESEEDYLKRLRFEICTSKNTIENKLNTNVKFLCWPHGDNTIIAHQIAKECGYLATTVGSKQVISDSLDRIPLRIGLYHSRNSQFLSMLKVRYRIGSFLGKFPYKQLNILYNLFKYGKYN